MCRDFHVGISNSRNISAIASSHFGWVVVVVVVVVVGVQSSSELELLSLGMREHALRCGSSMHLPFTETQAQDEA